MPFLRRKLLASRPDPSPSSASRNSGAGRFRPGLLLLLLLFGGPPDAAAQTQPVITIAKGSAVAEGGKAAFTVTAAPGPSTALTVSLSVAEDDTCATPATGCDFIASGNEGGQTIEIPAVTGNMDIAVTYEVDTVNDNTDEADGAVVVTVVDGTGYTVGAAGEAETTVRDNDGLPYVGFKNPFLITKVQEDAGSVDIVLTLSPASGREVVASISTIPDTTTVQCCEDAQPGEDFDAQTRTRVVFAPGVTEQTASIPITDDSDDEFREDFRVTLGNLKYVRRDYPVSIDVRIIDNDATVVSLERVAGNTGDLSEGGSAKAEFTVSLSKALIKTLTATDSERIDVPLVISGVSGSMTTTRPRPPTMTFSSWAPSGSSNTRSTTAGGRTSRCTGIRNPPA